MGKRKDNEAVGDVIRKHIVVSAVNIRKGGTLTILRDCLKFLSGREEFRVTALVHDSHIVGIPGIEYIDIPWSTNSWGHRLWCEYVTMNRISRTLQPVDLWLSLHDTSPRVRAKRQAVYCHTSFPFMTLKWRDWIMDYKIPLFRLFTRFAYRINVRQNDYLIVQQQWMRESLSGLLHFPEDRIILAPPAMSGLGIQNNPVETDTPMFFYPATPDCHKNFETLCRAAEILQNRQDALPFRLVLTIDGTENRYSKYIKSRFGHVSSIDFHGYMSRQEMADFYARASCLVFPSRIETWGLPISEFKPTGKPMILADMPYAHETASGAPQVAFYSPVSGSSTLADYMYCFLNGNKPHNYFNNIPEKAYQMPLAKNWDNLFKQLLEQ